MLDKTCSGSTGLSKIMASVVNVRILCYFFMLCLLEQAASDCPRVEDSDMFVFRIGSTCYHYIEGRGSNKVTYDYAKMDCESRNGHMLTIKDNATQQQLMSESRLGMVSDSHTIVLGLRQAGSEWKWVTGETANYFNWKPNSPTVGSCAKMLLKDRGTWERYDCGSSEWYYAYVCEHSPYSDGSLPVIRKWVLLLSTVMSVWSLAQHN